MNNEDLKKSIMDKLKHDVQLFYHLFGNYIIKPIQINDSSITISENNDVLTINVKGIINKKINKNSLIFKDDISENPYLSYAEVGQLLGLGNDVLSKGIAKICEQEIIKSFEHNSKIETSKEQTIAELFQKIVGSKTLFEGAFSGNYQTIESIFNQSTSQIKSDRVIDFQTLITLLNKEQKLNPANQYNEAIDYLNGIATTYKQDSGLSKQTSLKLSNGKSLLPDDSTNEFGLAKLIGIISGLTIGFLILQLILLLKEG